jgi:hypothetical protein
MLALTLGSARHWKDRLVQLWAERSDTTPTAQAH